MSEPSAPEPAAAPSIGPDRAGPPLGLVGLGLLGSAIAERLLQAGWPLLGWDIDPARTQALEALGAPAARSLAHLAASCPCVLLCLPSDQVVAEVVESPEVAWRVGQILIDTSTGAPGPATALAQKLQRQSVAYLDATVSGSSQQMRQGHAILMVGALDDSFQACRELFACLAAQTFHVGPPGAGARMKLVTNLVLGLNRAALAEGLAFAQAIGVDPASALEVLAASPAYSRVMDTKGRKMLARDFSPQARLSQHLKDVRILLQEAAQAGLTLPLSDTHRQLLERAESLGLGSLDNSAIIQALQDPQS